MAKTEIMDELDFLIEYRELEKKFKAGKEAAEKNPDRADDPEWRAVKDELRAYRQKWREVRAAFAVEPDEGDAVASPDTHGLKAEGKSV